MQQQNFDAYRLLRLNEMPELDIELVVSAEAPGGIDEPATALGASASRPVPELRFRLNRNTGTSAQPKP